MPKKSTQKRGSKEEQLLLPKSFDDANAPAIQEAMNSATCLRLTAKYAKLFFTSIFQVFGQSELTAAAWPILGTMILHAVHSDERLSFTQKLAITIPLWQVFALCGMWVQFGSIGRRAADGEADKLISGPVSDAILKQNAPGRVALTYLAMGTGFADGFLAGYALNSNPTSIAGYFLSFGMGAVMAFVKGMTFTLSDAPSAWKKYTQATNETVYPLAQQHGMQWLYKHASKIALFLREVYPPGIGALHSMAFFQVAMSLLGAADAPLVTKIKWAGAFSPLLFMLFEGGSMFARNFDVQQMIDAVELSGAGTVKRDGVLVQSDYKILRAMGKTLNGDLLFEVFNKCFGPKNATFAAALVGGSMNAIGLSALGYRGLTEYICDNNLTRVQLGETGKVFNFLFGADATVFLANHFAPNSPVGVQLIEQILAGGVGPAQTLGKFATVRQHMLWASERDERRADIRSGQALSDTLQIEVSIDDAISNTYVPPNSLTQ